MSTYRELLLGCGYSRDKRVVAAGTSSEWINLFTLDRNSYCKPDYLCDLQLLMRGKWRLFIIQGNESIVKRDETRSCDIFEDDVFDEIHAYEVLEHLGMQGSENAFFDDFSEIYRVLKPNGYLCATVPSRFSPWLWGDPSHRRAILPESLIFLDQTSYAQCDGPNPTPMSDFRPIYGADFKIVEMTDNHRIFSFVLQAVKPSRIVERNQ